MHTFEGLRGGDLVTKDIHRVLDGIGSAARWLMGLNSRDLEGDDSVGWWLLLFTGSRLPPVTHARLEAQLKKSLTTLRLGTSSLYTATAIARTLSRANCLSNATAIANQFVRILAGYLRSPTLKKSDEGNLPLDVVWLLQALYEIAGPKDPEAARVIQPLLHSAVSTNIVTAAMIWPVVSACTPDLAEHHSRSLLGARQQLTSPQWLASHADWEVSYLLLSALALGMHDEAADIVAYLLDRQTNSQWDELSDENVEATSLVGLSLARYCVLRMQSDFTNVSAGVFDWGLAGVLGKMACGPENIETAWISLNAVENPRIRGERFEQFIAKYAALSGLVVKKANRRTDTEEIDLELENQSPRSYLKSGLILVECKFTNRPTGAAVVRDFHGKVLNRRRPLFILGLIVSVSGFSKDSVLETQKFNARNDSPVLLVSGKELAEAIADGKSLADILDEGISRM